ncbi:lipopolysaccharide transport periplasmic protein LptA [Burkholderiaceae bacterium DAT-1]|nr:lipopolysaccharide transport periplasmic protein LptA [Burkholderiaceae bacterium DAT-1]
MRMNAENCLVDQKARQHQLTVCNHGVLITQGTLQIKADKVTIVSDAAGQQVFTLDGSPVEFRQKLDGTKGWVIGKGKQAVMKTASNEANLTGEASIQTPDSEVTGASIQYNMSSGETRVIPVASEQGKSTVRLTFKPKTRSEKAPTP